MSKVNGELTEQQERFCREYIIDLNGKQAAIRAGYSKKSAEVAASRLLRLDKVQQFIQHLINKRSKKTDISAEKVLRELARIAFSNMGDLADWTESGVSFKPSRELTRKQKAAIMEVTEHTNQHGGSLKIKQHDKVKAIELLGRHLKLFTDKMEHSGGMTLEQLLTGDTKKKDKDL